LSAPPKNVVRVSLDL